MTSDLLHTPLYNWHASNGGRIVDFAGWAMPVQYSSILQEHKAVRQNVGLFDVSHMGRFWIRGGDVWSFLDSLTTRRVAGIEHGKIRYSLMCKEDGCILDDVLVYNLGTEAAPAAFMVVNASNRSKIWDWLKANNPPSSLSFSDITLDTAMIAIQGPKANSLASKLFSYDIGSLGYYTGTEHKFGGSSIIISRTGYTGEDGCEVIVPKAIALGVWESLLSEGSGVGTTAVGLGARDTLRLEAAMPLYGHELSEQINAADTNLSFAIALKNRSFVGSKAIQERSQSPSRTQRVGIKVDGKRPVREHSSILVNGTACGETTSGTISPTLGYPIAMGYLPVSFANVGQRVQIDVRGSLVDAEVVQLPFYTRPATN